MEAQLFIELAARVTALEQKHNALVGRIDVLENAEEEHEGDLDELYERVATLEAQS